MKKGATAAVADPHSGSPSAPPPSPRRTPLYAQHQALGARLIEFGGWMMPVQYTGILEEHRTVRMAAGLFDLSHMGEIHVSGPGTLPFLQRVCTNDIGRITVGAAQYNALCLPSGGIVDDLVVYRLGEQAYMLVVNAANTAKDLQWLQSHSQPGVTLEDRTLQTALIAIQGPKAQAILQRVAEPAQPLDDVGFYRFTTGRAAGVPAILSRTGYTGEDGFEVYVDAGDAEQVWSALMAAGEPEGLVPVGLGARDTLRLEMRYPLYGNDIDETTTPLEGGLAWITRLEKPEFIGREALLRQREEGIRRRLIGFAMTEKGVPRHGYPIVSADGGAEGSEGGGEAEGRPIGVVTSGNLSPSRGDYIGMGYVEVDYAGGERPIAIDIRGRHCKAALVKGSFVPSRTRRPGK